MPKTKKINKSKVKPLEKKLADQLADSKRTISVAESCTGGLLAHRLTTIPGSSGYFLGGVVAYSNQVKKTLLGVSEQMLETSGAVSPEVAYAMAEGAKELFDSDITVSVTGIAGPGGGTLEKPVGLAYLGFIIGEKKFTKKVQFKGGRLLNKIHFSQSALQILLKNL